MTVINVCGPPCSLKSTFIARFFNEINKPAAHDFPIDTNILWGSIDNYRTMFKGNEEQAWYQLMKDIVQAPHCIIETSGTSWRLKARILEHPVIEERGIITIVFYGKEEDFLKRLKERKEKKLKKKIPFMYKELSEESLIRYTLEELPKRFPEGHYLITDDSSDIEEVYMLFKSLVLNALEKGKKNK